MQNPTPELLLKIASWENLESALRLSLRGGRRQGDEAQQFLADVPRHLSEIGHRVLNQQGPRGEFKEFFIRDPKPRRISGPCFADRVYQHAVFRVLGPLFESLLRDDVFACRQNLGCQAALKQALCMTRVHGWFLKLDVRHFFETVPRVNLEKSLETVPGVSPCLPLLKSLVNCWLPGRKRGMPIGSLSSQYYANHFLRELDQVLAPEAGSAYARYMDDMVVWADDPRPLRTMAQLAREKATQMGLELKDTILQPCDQGLPFLGMRITPSGMGYLSKTRSRRFHRMSESWDESDSRILQRSWDALQGRSAASRDLCGTLNMTFDESTDSRPRQSRWQLEQQRRELPLRESQLEQSRRPQQQPGLPACRSSLTGNPISSRRNTVD